MRVAQTDIVIQIIYAENHSFLAGSGDGDRLRLGGIRMEGGESGTDSKADKIAVSRGARGAVIMLEGGGRETEIGEGNIGLPAL